MEKYESLTRPKLNGTKVIYMTTKTDSFTIHLSITTQNQSKPILSSRI